MKAVLHDAPETPVIDIHAHVFGARDIPVLGYLRSRRSAKFLENLFAFFLGPWLCGCLDKKARNRGPLCNLMLEVVSTMMGGAYREWARTLSYDTVDIATELVDSFPNTDLFVPLMIDYEYWFRARRNRLIEPIETQLEKARERRFLARQSAVAPAPAKVQSMKKGYAGVMPIAEQVDAVHNEIILPHQGHIHPFVAYDPARELAFQDGKVKPPNSSKPEPTSSQWLVEKAVGFDPNLPPEWAKGLDAEELAEAATGMGFIGVKLYCSLGYSPTGNESVHKYRRKKVSLHKRLSKRRYHRHFSGDEYDGVLDVLYKYCAANGVPITVHCGMYGIEAFPGGRNADSASYAFGRAALWRPVLEKHPNLHLNLAHFGWNSGAGYYGKDDKGNESWIKEICEMMVEYPNLYADVSHHSVLDYPERRRIGEIYPVMRYAAGKDWDTIKKRILYGVDWHVIKRERNYPNFEEAYIRLLEHTGLFTVGDLQDFLYCNSIRFLNLRHGEPNYKRLEAFYQAQQIPHPDWFKAIPKLVP